eukprot:2289210-Amphidinium_carterae.1
MDPTSEEIQRMSSVGAALKWAGISGSPKDPGSDAKTLLTHLSMEPESLPRWPSILMRSGLRRPPGGYLGAYRLAPCKKFACAWCFVLGHRSCGGTGCG